MEKMQDEDAKALSGEETEVGRRGNEAYMKLPCHSTSTGCEELKCRFNLETC